MGGGFGPGGALDASPDTKDLAITAFPNPPAEMAALEAALRGVPMNPFGSQCDDFIKLLAEGAEKAAAACKPTFDKAVDGLNFKDARAMWRNPTMLAPSTWTRQPVPASW